MKQKKAIDNDFIKTLTEVAYRNSLVSVFDDFLEMAICCFAMQSMEEKYRAIAERYNEKELNLIARALGQMIDQYIHEAIDGGWDDVIGKFFEEINNEKGASMMGQFFTPKAICDLMAQITKSLHPLKWGTTVNDCAAGSGRNLIAHSRLDALNRFNCVYHAYDLDRRCVNMSVINMVMYGMKGYVIHMDTLKMEVYGGYRIYLPETGMGVRQLSKSQCMYAIHTAREDKETIEIPSIPLPTPIPVGKYVQASLF